MTEPLLKILGLAGESIHGETCTWRLPTGQHPGAWMPPIEGNDHGCRSYHLARLAGFHDWTKDGCIVYLAEGRGEKHRDDYRVAYREARLIRRLDWDSRIARLFAADCAQRVLPIFERDHPNDDRPGAVIEIARRFAAGQATENELAEARAAGDAVKSTVRAARDAAWAASLAALDAAWAAAGATARIAAIAAARAADAVWSVCDDVGDAGGAVGDSAWAAEISWQERRLAWYLGLLSDEPLIRCISLKLTKRALHVHRAREGL